MPKYSFTVDIESTRPLKTKDIEEFIAMAVQNQQQRYAVGSDINAATITISSPTTSEKIATLEDGDTSGTVDSDDLDDEGGNGIDQGSGTDDIEEGDEAGVDDDELTADPEAEADDETPPPATPPKTDPFAK